MYSTRLHGTGEETQPKQRIMSNECSKCILKFTSNPEVEKHKTKHRKNNKYIRFLLLALTCHLFHPRRISYSSYTWHGVSQVSEIQLTS